MPWTKNDVDKHKAGLDDKQKEKWVRIANESLAACIENGGTDETCAPKAIRIANSQFSDKGEIIYTAFQEIKDTDEFQLILPIGHWHHPWYGELDITDETCADMVANWEAKVLGERQPYIDTDHDGGAANGWIVELEARDAGLFAKIEWTEPGKELLEKGIYKYFSAEMGDHMDIDTGLKVKNVLIAATLTNRPFMNTMPEAHLKDVKSSAHRDRVKIISQEDSMTFAEIKGAVLGLPKGEQKEIAEASGFGNDGTKLTELTDQNTKLKEQVEVFKDTNKTMAEKVTAMETKELSERKETTISLAIKEGRILPADKEKWEKRFDSQPDFTEEILKEQPKVVDLSDRGTGSGGTEEKPMEFTDNDRRTMKAMDLSEEDYKKYLAGPVKEEKK